LILRYALWSVLGQGVPLFVALFAIPLLIEGMGTARFGVLTLAWMTIGYFSLFDLGLSRALTKLTAEKLAAGREDELSSLVPTALALMGGLGVLGAGLLLALAPWLAKSALEVPESLWTETKHAFYLLALALPIVISTAGLRGILEAKQRFGGVALINLASGIGNFLVPLATLSYWPALPPIVASLVLLRFFVWSAYFAACRRAAPYIWERWKIDRYWAIPLARFGGWLTVSNIVGPLMVYFDRFVIAALLSVTAVAYYVTPYDVVTRIGILATSVAAVLFPSFSASFAINREQARVTFAKGVKYLFLGLFPIILVAVAFADHALDPWLGPEFAENSATVLRFLAVGVLLNGLAQIPFALIQAAGRPDFTAKLHVIELPFYLLALGWLIMAFGIEGAALAWLIRAGIDAVVLFAFAVTTLELGAGTVPRALAIFIVALGLLALAAISLNVAATAGMLAATLMIFGAAAWLAVLDQEEKTSIKRALNVLLLRGPAA
jgi:O-antigen/teichoic acid export membrane protein